MRKTLIGKVISVKMNKTVVVKVEKKLVHSKYRKVIVRHKKFKVHNENLKLNLGDIVRIGETRPISKDKHFEVIEKLNN